jgi:predicted lipoprotein with Yx(FWY)xxD motif
MRRPTYIRLVGLLVLVSLAAAACSSGPSKLSNSSIPGLKPAHGITVFSYKTAEGNVVGTIFGGIAYADKDETSKKIVCTGNCTLTWRPWIVDNATVHPQAGTGVQASLIGTIKRSDGERQLTYGGHPLYLYAHQANNLRTNAQGAGGVWYVVGLDGKQISTS